VFFSGKLLICILIFFGQKILIIFLILRLIFLVFLMPQNQLFKIDFWIDFFNIFLKID